MVSMQKVLAMNVFNPTDLKYRMIPCNFQSIARCGRKIRWKKEGIRSISKAGNARFFCPDLLSLGNYAIFPVVSATIRYTYNVVILLVTL